MPLELGFIVVAMLNTPWCPFATQQCVFDMKCASLRKAKPLMAQDVVPWH